LALAPSGLPNCNFSAIRLTVRVVSRRNRAAIASFDGSLLRCAARASCVHRRRANSSAINRSALAFALSSLIFPGQCLNAILLFDVIHEDVIAMITATHHACPAEALAEGDGTSRRDIGAGSCVAYAQLGHATKESTPFVSTVTPFSVHLP
jgi:hypothetical protein